MGWDGDGDFAEGGCRGHGAAGEVRAQAARGAKGGDRAGHHLAVAVEVRLVVEGGGTGRVTLRLFIRGQALSLDECTGSHVVRSSLGVFVHDGVSHDSLSMNGQDGVCWHIYPVFYEKVSISAFEIL